MENIRVEINEQGRKQIVVKKDFISRLVVEFAMRNVQQDAPEAVNGEYRWDLPWFLDGIDIEGADWQAWAEFFADDWENGQNGREMDAVLWHVLTTYAFMKCARLSEQ